MDYLAIGCRCLFGIVFAASAVTKLRSAAALRAFVASLKDFGVPEGWRRPLALAVGAGEASVPLLVLTDRGSTVGLLVATVLLTAFSVGIVGALRRGVRAPCRCFGVSATPLGVPHVVRNSVLGGLAVAGAVGASMEGGDVHGGGLAIAAAAGAVAAVVTIAFDDVVALFSTSGATTSKGTG